MKREIMIALIFMAAGIAAALFGSLLRRRASGAVKSAPDDKKSKRKGAWGKVLMVLGGWLFIANLLTLIFGKPEAEELSVEIASARFDLFGLSISTTMVTVWVLTVILVAAAILLRILVVPRMKDIPHGVQNMLELSVDGIQSYVGSKVHFRPEGLSSYIFTIAVFMVACACVELLGLRAPTSDITMTIAMALITFALINYYGIKQKGVKGRIKSLAMPTPVVLPLRVLSDCAIPISMACRLFGNMLGGMVVMELLYFALGNAAVGIPSVAGLYFNVFHPLIQAFIFVTLTLTFIGEATEE